MPEDPCSRDSDLKRALLIMVHGSPRMTANDPVFRVVEDLRTRADYELVQVGFLECNEPSIPEAIEACVQKGAVQIHAIPYFLHTGKHVAADIPDLLDEARDRFPHVRFRMARYLGSSPRITELIARRAKSVRPKP
jgi:sirohydrochlorin cobaltochelatase